MYVAVASAQTKSYDEALSMLETGLNYVEENDAGTKSFLRADGRCVPFGGR